MNLAFPFLKFLFHHGTYNLQTPIQERNNLKAERIKLVTKTSFFFSTKRFNVISVFHWFSAELQV